MRSLNGRLVTEVKVARRRPGRHLYTYGAFDPEPVEPRATDPEGYEREERDAWESVKEDLKKHNGLSEEEADRIIRRARERATALERFKK